MTPFFNTLERALWTGAQTGVAILSADGLGWIEASPQATLAVAGVASLLSAIKTMAHERLKYLEAQRAG